MRLSALPLLTLSSLCLLACGEEQSIDPPTDGGTTVINCDGAPAVTATELHQAVISARCVTCHTANGTGPNDLSSPALLTAVSGKTSIYADASKTLKVVDPGNPANSTLYLKVHGGTPSFRGPKGESIGGRMPQGSNALSAAEQEQFRGYVCNPTP